VTLACINTRLAAAGTAAAATGLSVAIMSLAKVVLLLTALLLLLRGKRVEGHDAALNELWTPKLVLVVLAAFGTSLLWTSAPMSEALGSFSKYGKLLVIPALLVLIRTPREAGWALTAFLGAQAFLLISSWLLYFHLPVPWATSRGALTSYAVFSSYLDQGIMSAVAAAVFWQVRVLAPTRGLRYACMAMAVLALGTVFVVFSGRTGHFAGIVMMSLAIFWALPRRLRFASLLAIPLICLLVFFSFDKVAQRFSATTAEISAYSEGVGAATSADNRLDFWAGSLAAIAQHPFRGTGVGSWTTEYNRIQGAKNSAFTDLGSRKEGNHGNPHQEFLLWGVQLGVGGIALLLAFLGAGVADLLKMPSPVTRAGLSVLAALAVACLFNSSLYDAYIGDFFCLTLGILLAYGAHAGEQTSRHSAPIGH
jgi:O-antigen ligase